MIEQDSTDPTGVKWDGKGGGLSPTKARQRKAAAALQLKLSGASEGDIAQALGYPTERSVRLAIEKALEKELRENPKDREKMRQMASMRLDRLLRSVWPKAIDMDNPEQLVAVTKSREIIADWRRLHGTDAPAEVIVHSPTENTIEEWVAKVINLGLPPVEEDDVLDLDEDDYTETQSTEPRALEA